LGGPAIPGVGFALGVERLVMLLKMQEQGAPQGPRIYVAWVGDGARDWLFPRIHRLRRLGLRIEMEGESRSLKSQMRRADKLGARAVLIVGEDELTRGAAALRDMASKRQEEIKFDQLEAVLAARKES
jgi:histidyl-tRNA synthetase